MQKNYKNSINMSHNENDDHKLSSYYTNYNFSQVKSHLIYQLSKITKSK